VPARECPGLDADAARERPISGVGSPGDAPMFARLPGLCRVARAVARRGLLDADSRDVTRTAGGAGQAEAAGHLPAARRS